MGTYLPRLQWNGGIGPRGHSRSALTPETPANQQSASDWGLPTLWGGIEPGDFLYGPGLLQL